MPSRVFRGKFVVGLKLAFRQRKLLFPGSLKQFPGEKAFHAFLRPLSRQDWVVRAKRPPASSGICFMEAQFMEYSASIRHASASRVLTLRFIC